MVTVAPERRAVAEGIHAEMMPTANPDDDLAMHNRIDPYWDSLWAPGSTSLWATGNLVRARKEEDLGRKRVRRMLTSEEAMLILTANRGRTDRHTAWGCLQSWRTMSAEQLAAFTGSRYFLDPDYSQIAASFALELIDIGRFANYAASTHRTVRQLRRQHPGHWPQHPLPAKQLRQLHPVHRADPHRP